MHRHACLFIAALTVSSAALADPTNILFVGNSYTFGRVHPVLNGVYVPIQPGEAMNLWWFDYLHASKYGSTSTRWCSSARSPASTRSRSVPTSRRRGTSALASPRR